MANREMTIQEIKDRIADGNLVVYLQEEYGHREWFWFPGMSESDLMAYWDRCIADHFFNPSGLPGDVVPLPEEEALKGMTTSQIEEYYDKAFADPCGYSLLSDAFHNATQEEKTEIIALFDSWREKYFPTENFWSKGWGDSENNWTAHTHMDDDSWLHPAKKRVGNEGTITR